MVFNNATFWLQGYSLSVPVTVLAKATAAPDTGLPISETVRLQLTFGLFNDERAMTNSEIRNLLTKLRSEIQNAQIDTQTRNLMRELDSDIHNLLDPEKAEIEAASVLERARAVEANFETDHPTAVRILREVIEALARMGI